MAQRAAVVGRRFSPAAVAALGPTDALTGLEQLGFVHRAGTLYRFHHVLVRDVVYAGTPKAERAKLHLLHAAWLDESSEGSDELVGYHLEQAVAYQRELGTPSERAGRLGAERISAPPASGPGSEATPRPPSTCSAAPLPCCRPATPTGSSSCASSAAR